MCKSMGSVGPSELRCGRGEGDAAKTVDIGPCEEVGLGPGVTTGVAAVVIDGCRRVRGCARGTEDVEFTADASVELIVVFGADVGGKTRGRGSGRKRGDGDPRGFEVLDMAGD